MNTMLTTRALKWLLHRLGLVARDAAYFTLVTGLVLALPLVAQGADHSKLLMTALHVDDPMVGYLADVGGHAILLGNLVAAFAALDAATRLLTVPLFRNLAWLCRSHGGI